MYTFNILIGYLLFLATRISVLNALPYLIKNNSNFTDKETERIHDLSDVIKPVRTSPTLMIPRYKLFIISLLISFVTMFFLLYVCILICSLYKPPHL